MSTINAAFPHVHCFNISWVLRETFCCEAKGVSYNGRRMFRIFRDKHLIEKGTVHAYLVCDLIERGFGVEPHCIVSE